jgi:hypothetical protein
VLIIKLFIVKKKKEALYGRVDGLIVRECYCSSISSSSKRNKYFLTDGGGSVDDLLTECKSQGMKQMDVNGQLRGSWIGFSSVV